MQRASFRDWEARGKSTAFQLSEAVPGENSATRRAFLPSATHRRFPPGGPAAGNRVEASLGLRRRQGDFTARTAADHSAIGNRRKIFFPVWRMQRGLSTHLECRTGTPGRRSPNQPTRMEDANVCGSPGDCGAGKNIAVGSGSGGCTAGTGRRARCSAAPEPRSHSMHGGCRPRGWQPPKHQDGQALWQLNLWVTPWSVTRDLSVTGRELAGGQMMSPTSLIAVNNSLAWVRRVLLPT